LLEQLAATPTERRSLLRQYFEPTPIERQDGLKVPTKAHRAIARLVAGGCVRVVVTTNFDQLLETALRDEGVVPAVVSTADAIAGMMPLHLSPATIIKVHGDYLDVRIRNTVAELAEYPPELNGLLDRVFDEYGLIVVGWSADWDAALRSAIERCASRRFTTFWAQFGDLRPEAERLISHRRAQTIAIAGADSFFESIEEKVSALSALGRPHPLSLAIAVATLKRYMPVPADRIKMHAGMTTRKDRRERRAPDPDPDAPVRLGRRRAVASSLALTTRRADEIIERQSREGPDDTAGPPLARVRDGVIREVPGLRLHLEHDAAERVEHPVLAGHGPQLDDVRRSIECSHVGPGQRRQRACAQVRLEPSARGRARRFRCAPGHGITRTGGGASSFSRIHCAMRAAIPGL
jgi:hypothetical protein